MVTSTTRTLSAGRQALSADLAGLSETRRNPSRSARHAASPERAALPGLNLPGRAPYRRFTAAQTAPGTHAAEVDSMTVSAVPLLPGRTVHEASVPQAGKVMDFQHSGEIWRGIARPGSQSPPGDGRDHQDASLVE